MSDYNYNYIRLESISLMLKNNTHKIMQTRTLLN